jgi:uncharacterized protein
MPVLRPDGTLRVGVVSDTHSEPNASALRHLAALKPDVILHGGDIGDLAVLKQLEQLAPVHAVRGNIDDASSGLPETELIAFDRVDGTRALTALLTHVAVYGPRIRADVAKKARAAGASLIVCGHSHVPFMAQERGLTVFNPGSIGPRRPGLPMLFGLMDVGPKGVKLEHIDGDSGARWLPP